MYHSRSNNRRVFRLRVETPSEAVGSWLKASVVGWRRDLRKCQRCSGEPSALSAVINPSPSAQVFLGDLEWGRQQQQSFWKRLHFRRVEKGVRQTLQMLEKDAAPPSTGYSKSERTWSQFRFCVSEIPTHYCKDEICWSGTPRKSPWKQQGTPWILFQSKCLLNSIWWSSFLDLVFL